MFKNKKQFGQYFTKVNPFILKPFKEWLSLVEGDKLLEPFAGSNNLVKMIQDIYGEKYNWTSFDINPPKQNSFPSVEVVEKDTVADMPKGFSAIITNPPYLARNSATRRGLKFHKENKYDDLYKFCLEKMLSNYSFVAAIIPESFITSGLFHDNLWGVISLTVNMFDDTDCPVCIAMFTPPKYKSNIKSFKIWKMNNFIGDFISIKDNVSKKISKNNNLNLVFNDKDGIFGLKGVDGTKKESISFVCGDEINPDNIKNTSRAVTRIGFNYNFSENELNVIIKHANKILKEYRSDTNDIFMTAFKGLREDGNYRRRLDFYTAKNILSLSINDFLNKNKINITSSVVETKLEVEKQLKLGFV